KERCPMNKTIPWSLGLSFIVVSGLIWTFTPKASTNNNKLQEVSKTLQDGPAPAYRSPGARHKVTASDEKSAAALEAQGARVIADYGGYKLFDVSSDLAAKTNNLAGVGTVDENNLVLLNSGSIDTTTSEAQDMRSAKGGGATTGRQMHLIQFAGPIMHEWYDALVATGVRVVTYIPNNAYLVYGDSKSINSV